MEVEAIQHKIMAHFAKIDENNVVIFVEVVSNDVATNEQAGVDFLNGLYGYY